MRRQPLKSEFHSPLAELMKAFLQEKMACGNRYTSEGNYLHSLDRFLVSHGLASAELPRPLVEAWTAKRAHERPSTHQRRVGVTRRLAQYLVRHGVKAHIPDARANAIAHRRDFVPYIFTREEIARLLRAVDQIQPHAKSPLRYRVMPEVFRLLYGCGMRVGEVLALRVRHVDLDSGVLIVREAKFDKDRFVPVASSLADRLRSYDATFGLRSDDDVFFPAPGGSEYSHGAVYDTFRALLSAAGIRHGGRGRGPRLHDLRATFAVHRLEAWYRQGEDLNAKLPILSTYLGHDRLAGTQWYLRLTPNLFPDIVASLEKTVGEVIPAEVGP